MRRHGASRETLAELYELIISAGALTWESGHLVSASALVYGQAIDYLLRHIETLRSGGPGASAIAYRLLLYFRNNESGAIMD